MKGKDKNILVTGGAGYVGSVLVRALLEKGYQVRVLDNMRWGGEALIGLEYLGRNIEVLRGDVCCEDDLKRAVKGVDAVVHLAAIVGDPACQKEPELARRINLVASKSLFALAREAGVGTFIFASTCSNYGKMADTSVLVTETSPLRPVSLYAELKVAFEQHMFSSPQDRVFTPVSLRFSTVYGVSPRMRFDLTVNEFVRDVFLGKELVVFGEQFWRPYCHVKDIAQAILVILESPREKIDHEVYNIGDGKENYQKKMLVEEIAKFIPTIKVKYIHKDEDPRDYKVDFTKAQKQLGYQVQHFVPEGMREIASVLAQGLWKDPYDKKYQNS